MAAESTPTLEDIENLAAAAPVGSYDWGEHADVNASEWTARIILSSVIDMNEAIKLAAAYAADVVRRQMTTDRMWIVSKEEVGAWLKKYRKTM